MIRSVWGLIPKILFILCLSPLGQFLKAQDCDEVLKHGICNTESYSRSDAIRSASDDLIYSLDIRSEQQAMAAGFAANFPIYDVMVGGKADYSDSSRVAWRKEYESRHSRSLSIDQAQSNFRSSINPEIVNAWLQCKIGGGLEAGLSLAGPSMVYIWASLDARQDLDRTVTSLTLPPHSILIEPSALKGGVRLYGSPIGALIDLSRAPSSGTIVINSRSSGSKALSYDLTILRRDSQVRAEERIPTAGFIVGEVRSFAFETLPKSLIDAGWMECDGRYLQTDKYLALYKMINASWGTPTPEINGTRPISFRIPDLQGMFVRGWSHGKERDLEARDRRALYENGLGGDHVGSYQPDTVGPHAHKITPIRLEAQGGSGFVGGGLGSSNSSPGPIPQQNTEESGPKMGRSETRPKNVYLLYAVYTGVEPPNPMAEK